MSWSYQVAKPFGIDLKVHATFFLVVVLAAYQWAPLGLAGAAFGAGLVLALFVCVALHELGHALSARFFGLPVRTITLLPIGGIAHLDREPTKPMHELIIAAAGPAVNVVIAIGLFLLMGLLSASVGVSPARLLMASPALSLPHAMAWLLQANIALVLFNMIPAFPMDGGRVLRAALALRLPYPRATRIAAGVSQLVMAVAAVYALLTGQIFLLAIAAMIFLSASATKREAARQPEYEPMVEPAPAETTSTRIPPQVVRVEVRRVDRDEAGRAYRQAG